MNLIKLRKAIFSKSVLRGFISVGGLIAFWELGRRLQLPGLAVVPAPSEVFAALSDIVAKPEFWDHWYASFTRVLGGFIAAQLIGIPLGLMMAMNRYFHAFTFPLLEIMRPIPPLAWVPAAIIFWPTTELSIGFVIFLGAFFTVVVNVIGSARNIDVRYLRAAQSLGSRPIDIFKRIILPAVLPGIFIGMAVGMGITWEVVVAAEMIAGKSGLGYLTWSSYVGGNYPQIIIGMISIGIAGYISSSLIRLFGRFVTPWQSTQ
ncbi:MAG: nitrate ABC transporter permease [Alphaproteobacteria bacterium BRH_c36]|nr:MAG: nitrate ABC transporter permease [Alphaproteobacteria bacterium BRH_c36]